MNTAITPGAPRVEGRAGHRELRPLGVGLLALAGCLLVNTAAGPLVSGLIDYPISDSMLNQLLGLELVTVLLVVPATVAAGLLALRDHPAAPLLAVGPAAYTTYMFVQYVVGPEYPAYSVTVVFHVVLVALSGALTLWGWALATSRPVPDLTPRQRRRRALLMAGLAAFVLLRYLPALAGAAGGEPIAEEYLEGRTFFWSIFLLDLGVVVPAALAAAWAVAADRPAGRRAVYAVLGWFALVPPSVAAMAAVMLVRDDPYASASTLVLLGAAALAFLLAAVLVFRPVLTGGGTATTMGP